MDARGTVGTAPSNALSLGEGKKSPRLSGANDLEHCLTILYRVRIEITMIDARPRRILSELILLALLLVLLGVALYNKVWLCRNIITRHFLLTDSFHTPVLHIWDTRIQKKKGIAVLVHGLQCNKSMMVQLGKFLAAHGVDSYAIDLPGHGESSVPFTYERCYDAAKEATSEIIKLSGFDDKQVILVGHSFGSSVLGPVGLEHPDLAASVYIGPGEVKGLKVDAPPGTSWSLRLNTTTNTSRAMREKSLIA